MFTVERSLPLSRELPSWQSSDRFSRDDVQSDVARLLVAADRTRIEQPATPADMPLSVRESVTRRILIIDDNADARESYSIMCRSQGLAKPPAWEPTTSRLDDSAPSSHRQREREDAETSLYAPSLRSES
jgi:hypothetical protein